ncbi:MAG: membrane dipeptidase [Bacillota bacterium]|nr:membrane dipeptidase [Bacillota bacterium]
MSKKTRPLRIDCHADTPLWLLKQPSLAELPQAHSDYRRIAGYLDVAVLALWTDEAEYAGREAGHFRRLLQLLLDDIAAVPAAPRLLLYREQLLEPSCPLALLAMEGASPLGARCEHLSAYIERGLRMIGLTWNGDNSYAGGCAGDIGISADGLELIELCEQSGVVVDGAHLSRRSFWELTRAAKKPFIVSHTCCDALHPYRRNLDDEQLKAVAEAGGVVGVTFVPDFLGLSRDIAAVGAHIRHALRIAGTEAVAIGSDFDGTQLPDGMEGLQSLPLLYDALCAAGVDEAVIEKVAGENMRRVLTDLLPRQTA